MKFFSLGMILSVLSGCGFIAPQGLDPAFTIRSQLGNQPISRLTNPITDPNDPLGQQCQKFTLKTPLEQILHSQVKTQMISGTLFEEIAENMYTGYFKNQYFLKDDFGKIHALDIAPQVLNKSFHLVGKKVDLEVRQKENQYMMSSEQQQFNVKNIYESLLPSSNSLMIQQDIKVLAILVEFNNLATFTNFPMSQANNFMNTLKTYYHNVSRGQMNIMLDLDGDGNPDIAKLKLNRNHIKDGPNRTCGTYYFETLINQITDFDPNDYDKYMFFTISPNATGGGHCNYAGIARRPGSISHIAYKAQVTGNHEFGHNLGLQHASYDSNFDGIINPSIEEVYGDHSCIMGNYFDGEAHLNPPNAIDLGVFDEEPGSVLNVDSSGIYQLSPLASDSNASHPKILKIVGDLNQYDLSIAFRGDVDEDDDIKNDYRNKLGIYDGVTRDNGSSYGATGTAFFKALDPGAPEFTETNSELKVKFLSLNGQTAEVEITFPGNGNSGNNCFKAPPTIKLQGYQQADADSFDLYLSILNNNTDCDPMNLSLGLDSAHFNLASQANSISLMNGEEKNISVSVDLKNNLNLAVLTNLLGKVTFSEGASTNSYFKNFEIEHNPDCND